MNHMLLYKLEKSRFTLSDLESMLPWERDIYVNFIVQDMQEQAEKAAHNG